MRALPETLNAKQQAFVTMMGGMGIAPGTDAFWNLWDEQNLNGKVGRKTVAERQEAKVREIEFALAYLSMPNASKPFEHKCKACDRVFLTNYKYNKHCSLDCLMESCRRQGLPYDETKTEEERWGGEPPSVISPETLERLKAWAKNLLSEKVVTGPEKPYAENADVASSVTPSNMTVTPTKTQDITNVVLAWNAHVETMKPSLPSFLRTK